MSLLTAISLLAFATTGSGGAAAGGAASVSFVKKYAMVGSGGAIAGGSASVSFVKKYAMVGSGGATASGSAQPGRLFVHNPPATALLEQDGGTLLQQDGGRILWQFMGTFLDGNGGRSGGAAIFSRPFNWIPSGGATAGGAAVVSIVRSVTGSGGATASTGSTLEINRGVSATAGGSARIQNILSLTGTGGAYATGKATIMSSNDFKFQFCVGGPGFAIDDLLMARRTDYDAKKAKNVVFQVEGRVVGVSREGEATISIFKGKEHLARFGKNIEFTRYGNFTNTARQGSISIISDDTATNEFDKLGSTPCIDIRDGVNSAAMANSIATLRGRFGNLDGIEDPRFGAYQPHGFGVYTDNFFGTGTFIMAAGSKGFGMLSDRPQSLADLDPGAAERLDGIQTPTWESIKPEYFDDAPAAAGLFLNANFMGFYEDGWKTYMDINGDFYLKGRSSGENFLMWDASAESLYLRGIFEATDAANSYWSTKVKTDAFGMHVSTQIYGGQPSQFGVSCDVFSNSITWKANYGLDDDYAEYFAGSIRVQQTSSEGVNESTMTIYIPNVAITGDILAGNIQGNAVINDAGAVSKIRGTNNLLYSFNGTAWTVME